MAATTTQTAHTSISTLLNVRPQLERYVISDCLIRIGPSKRAVRRLSGASVGYYSMQNVPSAPTLPTTSDTELRSLSYYPFLERSFPKAIPDESHADLSNVERTKPEYRNSFDILACTVGPYKLWNIVNELSNTFNNDLHPQLRKHLNDKRSSIRPPRHYRGPREPRNALRCYLVGLTQDHASPHVAILCKEKWFRTQARHIILESGILQDRGWVGCIKLPYEIRQNGATSPAPRKTVDDPVFQTSASSRQNQHNVAISYCLESTNGLRIAISTYNGYVRIATIGGVIEIDGVLFGLSVSHIFSAVPSYDGTDFESESDTELYVLDEDDLDPSVRVTDSGEVLDVVEEYSDLPGIPGFSDKPTSARESKDIGSSSNIDNDTEEPLTGPRLHSETAKWRLGSWETFANETAYEFEWALISMDDDHNSTGFDKVANLAMTNSGEKFSITSVATRMARAGTRLHLTAPRGVITAIAIASESSVQLPSSISYLGLWTVRLDCPEDGDCGSWVVDHVTGELFGMLVATCKAVCEAYILPIKDIFTEIERLRGHSVKLPALDPITEKRELMTASVSESKPTKDLTSTSRGDPYSLYLPLQADSVRILSVLPGGAKAEIQCELSTRSLNSPGDYEGLCYVSGRSELTSCISVDGRLTQVNSSLASALKDLRYVQRPRPLWVDSLCINPNDIKERNSQVSLLAPIMLQARSVCIWLGERDDKSHWAFSSYLSVLGNNAPDDSNRHMLVELAEAFSSIFGRTWFSYGSVQAISLARYATIHCGPDSMSWKDFADVVAVLCSLDHTDNPFSYQTRDVFADLDMLRFFTDAIQDSIRWLDDGQIERKRPLGSLVITFSRLKTKIEHDTIYSMLSLARDVCPIPNLSIAPNAKTPVETAVKTPVQTYVQTPVQTPVDELPPLEAANPLHGKHTVPKGLGSIPAPLERQQRRPLIVDYSQPFEHVCKMFVQFAIQDSQSLDILCIPWAPPSERLPSWVPNSSQAPEVMNRHNVFQRVNGDSFVSGPLLSKFEKNRIYDASRLTSPKFRISNSLIGTPTISVEGFPLDTIQKKQSPALMGNIPPGWTGFLGWKDITKPAPEKAWRTLIGDRGRYPGDPTPAFYLRACEQAFRHVEPGHGLNIGQAMIPGDRFNREFLERVQAVVWGRRPIKTKSGFLGLAPEATKKQDIVAILYGLSVPVVLRHISNAAEGDNVFKMIGECFIYGMMDGEALDLKEEQGIQDQTFVLI